MKQILITGVTGFIGGAVLKKILADDTEYAITVIVRPETHPSRVSAWQGKVQYVEIDLGDSKALLTYLENHFFDTVLHIGALRGGRKFSNSDYYKANVVATELIIQNCLRSGSRLIFCSSVGVYGAIPEEMPANNFTARNADNYYHYTKIEAEKRINKAVMGGLKAAILRPSITYGLGDYGFPFQLVKMVKQHRFPMINKRIWIHLCHIDIISSAFLWLLKNDYAPGLALNVADREPVQLRDLVNFISRQLRNKNYPSFLDLDRRFFALCESFFKLIKNELWVSRIQLISKSWFYDVKETYELMNLTPIYTIPAIKLIIPKEKK